MNQSGSKPIVFFETFVRFVRVADNPAYCTATLLRVKGHPRLGDMDWVHTSRVLRVEFDQERIPYQAPTPCEIETLNTIYLRLKPVTTMKDET